MIKEHFRDLSRAISEKWTISDVRHISRAIASQESLFQFPVSPVSVGCLPFSNAEAESYPGTP